MSILRVGNDIITYSLIDRSIASIGKVTEFIIGSMPVFVRWDENVVYGYSESEGYGMLDKEEIRK